MLVHITSEKRESREEGFERWRKEQILKIECDPRSILVIKLCDGV